VLDRASAGWRGSTYDTCRTAAAAGSAPVTTRPANPTADNGIRMFTSKPARRQQILPPSLGITIAIKSLTCSYAAKLSKLPRHAEGLSK
jgi:hypothetical protein